MTGPPIQGELRLALDEQLKVLSISDGIEALLGFSAEDFLASRVRLTDCIHRDDADIAGMLFSPNIGNRSGTFNIRLRHADGRIRCVRGQYSKEAANGAGEAVLDLLLQDAQSLHEIQGEPASLTSVGPLMDVLGEALYFKNRNHVFTAANRTAMLALSTLDGDGTGLLGLTDYDLFPEEYADIYYKLEKEVFAGNPVMSDTRAVIAGDGKQRWVDNRKYPVRGINGEVIGLFGAALDITERVETEAALRESEESLREAQNIAGLGSYVGDLGNGDWTSSDVLDQMFGIDKEYKRTLEGWAALIHPEDRAMMVAYMEDEILGQKKAFDRNYRIVRHSDGAVRWVHDLGRLEFDGQGRSVKMHGTVQDITEGRQAEQALRESEESLKESQNIAGLGSYVLEIATGVWTSSDVLDRLFGIDKGFERTVEGWVALVHPEDRASMLAYLEGEVLGQGKSFDKEYRIVRHSDGAVRWVHGQGRLDFDAQGRPVKMHGTIRDVTERNQQEIALRESKELLQLFIEHAPAGLAMFDRDMHYLAASRRWLEMHSLLDRDVIGHSHYEIFPGLPESWKEEHRHVMAGGTLPPDERCFERAGCPAQWLRREIIPWRAGDGAVGGIIIFGEDITQQRENERRLRLAANVFTQAREGITITDPTGAILEVNEMFTHITGYTREEVLGRNPRLLKSGLQSAEFYEEMWRKLLQEGEWSGEIWNRAKNGDLIAEMLTINAVRDAGGNLQQYVALFSDITQIKKHAQQLEHVTHYDVLTSLPNRVLLADRLHQAMAQANRRKQMLAVAYLDLDGFKGINDLHGRDAGDRLLTSLAFNMKCALREGDTLARLGGDEFAAVMLDLEDAEASMGALAQLLEAAAETVQVGDLSLRVSASIGVTFYPQPEEADADLLLRQADQAMYQAKLAGGNRYHIFDPDHDQSLRGRHENLEHIRHALAAREFVLYYQPKVNMRLGKVVGAEALIRWQHPERGLLPPGMFLPVIEEHALAIEVGEWVIDSALAQMESWSAAGLEIPVSVNVGALQLQQADFVDRLSNLLAAHPRIKPFNVELEVLETSALQDVVKTSKVLNACHNIGVSFALDDFGTGYSSLTYLKRLPASVLKIDQSFVSDMLEDPENLNILEGILGLASAFHRQVIAEGVETVEHGLMLLQLGCELAQGYGIARPMPAGELQGWVSSWRPDPRWAEVPPVHSSNRALLYASVEHRAWMAAFEAFLQGKRPAPPALDKRHCRFGMWLEAEEQAGGDKEPAYRSVEAAHRQFHELAAEIIASQVQGRSAEGLGHLGKLHGLCDDLLAKLETLRQEC